MISWDLVPWYATGCQVFHVQKTGELAAPVSVLVDIPAREERNNESIEHMDLYFQLSRR